MIWGSSLYKNTRTWALTAPPGTQSTSPSIQAGSASGWCTPARLTKGLHRPNPYQPDHLSPQNTRTSASRLVPRGVSAPQLTISRSKAEKGSTGVR